MKKYILSALAMALLFAMGCQKEVNIEHPISEEPSITLPEEGISPEIYPATEMSFVTPSEFKVGNLTFNEADKTASYILANEGMGPIGYDSSYQSKKMNGYLEWEESLDAKEMTFDMTLKTLEAGKSEKITFDVSPLDGKSGAYRLTRSYTASEKRFDVHLYFSVDETNHFDHFELKIEE